MKISALADGNSIRQIVRFGIVGAVATAVYCFVAISLPALPYSVSPTSAALLASFVSVLVSYLGHHKVTFSKAGHHEFYLPRFLLVSAVLSCFAVGATYFLTKTLLIDYRVASLCVAVAYPLASFLLGRTWIFRDVY